MISRKEVQHIAKLARLGITREEEEKFAKELSSILDYFEKLKEVDVSKVEPTRHSITRALAKGGDEASASSTKIENVMRDDLPAKIFKENLGGRAKMLMELAPETKEGYLKVKSIL